MMRSRDLKLINDGLDLTRKFSLFYGSAGYLYNFLCLETEQFIDVCLGSFSII